MLCENILYFYSRYVLILGTKFVIKLNISYFKVRDLHLSQLIEKSAAVLRLKHQFWNKNHYAIWRQKMILSRLRRMTDLRALLTTSGMGLVVGGTMAKLWMATTAELARSGSLLVVISSPTSASVVWCSLDSRSCISPRVSSGASFVGNVVTGTGLVVNGSDVVLGRRLTKLYFLTLPPELPANAT
jgi:hypothetical protein